MPPVHSGAVTCRFGLAHVGSLFSVDIIVGAREVIDAGAGIDPNDSFGRERARACWSDANSPASWMLAVNYKGIRPAFAPEWAQVQSHSSRAPEEARCSCIARRTAGVVVALP